MRRIAIVVAAIVIVAIGVIAWLIFGPGPLAFAGGSTVALADYHEADPTGVPAELAKADIVTRGEYLAKAADWLVCHTAPAARPVPMLPSAPTTFSMVIGWPISPLMRSTTARPTVSMPPPAGNGTIMVMGRDG